MPQKRNRGKRPKQPNFLDNLYEAVMVAMEDVVNDAIDAVEMNAGRIIEQQEAQTKKRPRAKAHSAAAAGAAAPAAMRYPFITHYDVLEVSRQASPETIEAAYKSMCKRFHPDVSRHPQAEVVMKNLNAAWEVLKDLKKRVEYDRELARRGV